MNLQPMLHVYRQVQEDVYTNPLVCPDLHAKIKNILDLRSIVTYPWAYLIHRNLSLGVSYPS